MAVNLPMTDARNLLPQLGIALVTPRDAEYTSRQMVEKKPSGFFRAKFTGEGDLPPMIAEVVAAVSEGFCLMCRETLKHDHGTLACSCCGFVFGLRPFGAETEFEMDWPEPHRRCHHYQTLVARDSGKLSQD
jgi:hypothetical protein